MDEPVKKPHRSKDQIKAMEMRRQQQADRHTAIYGPKNERYIKCTNVTTGKCGREFAEKGPATILGAGTAPETCFYCGSPLEKRKGI